MAVEVEMKFRKLHDYVSWEAGLESSSDEIEIQNPYGTVVKEDNKTGIMKAFARNQEPFCVSCVAPIWNIFSYINIINISSLCLKQTSFLRVTQML